MVSVKAFIILMCIPCVNTFLCNQGQGHLSIQGQISRLHSSKNGCYGVIESPYAESVRRLIVVVRSFCQWRLNKSEPIYH